MSNLRRFRSASDMLLLIYENEPDKRQGRHRTHFLVIGLSAFILVILAPTSWSCALAAQYVTTLTQYSHTSWRVRDGEISGQVNGIAQTRDGYLWAGTEAGLERYDGVHFRHWPLPVEKPVYSVRGVRDGSLWIGGSSLLNLKDGQAITVRNTGGRFNEIYEDAEGTIWLVRSRTTPHTGALCKIDHAAIRCFGLADRQLCDNATSMARDATGEFWIGSGRGVCGWRPGVGRLIDADASAHVSNEADAFIPEPNGSMLVGFRRSGPHLGLQRMGKDGASAFSVNGLNGQDLQVGALLRDSQGALWIGTLNAGIYHINQGKVDHFDTADGLSSNTVNALFEDREGDVWVATPGGIDRFHQQLVSEFSLREGLSQDTVTAVLARRNGDVAFSTEDGLQILHDGVVTHPRTAPGVQGQKISSMFEDSAGKLWLGIDDDLAVYDGKKFGIIQVPGHRHLGLLAGFAEDGNHDLWVLTVGAPYRLYRIRNGAYLDEVHLPAGHRPSQLASTPDGAVWVPDEKSHLFEFKGAQIFSLNIPGNLNGYTELVGLKNGDLVLSSRQGAYYLRQGRWRLFDKARGLPCDDLDSVTEDNQGALWFRSRCGLMILAKYDLDHALQHPLEKIKIRFLDNTDGAEPGDPVFSPAASRSPNGRLWFATDGPAVSVDPAHLATNPLPPPVHIEQMIADHHIYANLNGVKLPPRSRDVEIDYAGLSLVTPQKVRFRYRLAGIDDVWQDVGTRRSAFYMNLKPRRYSFQVIASNNDGVWNNIGDSIEFTIPPAYYQTIWFKVALGLLLAALLWTGVWLRVRYVTTQIETRLSERQAERFRIARELHDTLLQGYQGLLMHFQTVADAIPPATPAKAMMDFVLDRAESVLVEGRDRVHDLRSADERVATLADELSQISSDLERYGCAPIEEVVSGLPRPLMHSVQREIIAIAKEALTNSCRHSKATSIFWHVTFTNSDVLLVCGDNGVGIDSATMEAGQREGHWGLTGMKERARQIGGTVEIASAPGSTRVSFFLSTRPPLHRRLIRRLTRWREAPVLESRG